MPSRNYFIVDALPGHIPFLAGIERACARTFPAGVVPEHLLDVVHPEEMFSAAADKSRLKVALKKGVADPVGFALLYVEEGIALLAEVDVLPSHGRQGIGKALVLGSVEAAGREGYEHLYLTTFRNVRWNYPFYRRLGFEAVPDDRLPEPMTRLLEEERQLGYSQRVAMRLSTGNRRIAGL